jgi:hypothetical protein
VAPAPMMTMLATISAARPAKSPPFERDIFLLSLSNWCREGNPDRKKASRMPGTPHPRRVESA